MHRTGQTLAETEINFPESSAKIARELALETGSACAALVGVPFLTFALYVFMYEKFFGTAFDRGMIYILWGLVFVLVCFSIVSVWNTVKPIQETVNSSLTDFRNSRNRKTKLISSVNSLAQRLSDEEFSTHHGIAQTAREAAVEISRGKSATIVLANLAAQFPTLNSSASFQHAQQNAAHLEEQIDADLRRVNRLISAYNEIVTAFPTLLVAKRMGFVRREYLSDEEILVNE